MTARNERKNQSNHDPSELGELERELLELVWQAGEATADWLRTNLGRSLKDSTIRTVLRRLEEKGYLVHTLDQRTFVYRPAQTRESVAARAMKRIADWFCEGSMEDLLVGLINRENLDKKELRAISTHIERLRKGGK